MDTSLFNEPQLKAIEYNDGPSLVIAGAGSGKTRVLTYKIAYLLEQGMEPWSIIALTFTNKAASEMKSRIAKIVGDDTARHLWMGTFHSMFLRILRTEHERLGFQPNFTIYDASDSKSLVKAIIKELHLDDKTYKPSAVLNRICAAKNKLITAKQYAANPTILQADMRSDMPAIHTIYTEYYNRCRSANAMDFDDILLYTYYLFQLYPEVLHQYAERFKFVLVDEYQDTNLAQHKIIMQLTQERQRVCVVGDDAQSIYSFRGAKIDNILSFQNLYPGTKVFKLEQNYRSTQTIVNAANSLIHKNKGQIKKNVFSERAVGDKISLTSTASDTEEAIIVAKKIMWLHSRDHTDYSDFAILYRTNAQSRLFEDNLRKQGIPYKVYGGLSFYQRKEVKDVIAYFRMAVNPNDEEALKRIINYPARGIGSTTVANIIACASSHQVSLWTVLCDPVTSGLKVNAGTLRKISEFQQLVQTFIDMASKSDAATTGRYIIENCGIIADIYQDKSAENLSRQENVEEILNGLADFCDTRREEGNTDITLSDYLSEVSLLGSSEEETSSNGDKESDDKVRLMTIHSAKGLEFPIVFIVGMEDGLFPNDMCMNNIREIEEERRLFYVAITRAMQTLFITYARCRMHFGKMEFGEPSRFLSDIDPEYLTTSRGGAPATVRSSRSGYERPDRRFDSVFGATPTPPEPKRDVELPWKRLHKISDSRSTVQPTIQNTKPQDNPATRQPSSQLRPGMVISHDRFGIGTIKNVEGEGDSLKATVEFQNAGTKQLLIKYARFTITHD